MALTFRTVDVFTDRMFGGNPLAVVLGGDGLETAQLQAIAREFNYSETTFVLPPADPAHHARVRIFTPGGELPFAGHPNVGTAFVLAGEWAGPLPDSFLFEEGAGLVPVRLLWEQGRVVGAELTAPEPFRQTPSPAAPAAIAANLSLREADVRTDRHAPAIVSVGLGFLAVELASRAALAAARAGAALAALLVETSAAGIYLYTAGRAADEADTDLQARMFAPHDGIPEDPATGSAAGAVGALLATLMADRDITLDLTIGQGQDLGRPSRLQVRIEKRDGLVATARVGGRCVPVMAGTLHDPGPGADHAGI